MSLRSILGGSRIKKRKQAAASHPQTASASWPASLPRTKAAAVPPKLKGGRADEDLFGDKLDDVGLMQCLSTDLSLRDVPQVMRHVRNRMFDPVPERASGMNSTRTAEVLNFRRHLPPISTTAHLHAILPRPSVTDREIAELTRAGIVRKIVVPRRGAAGEALVEMADIERLIQTAQTLGPATKDAFLEWLRESPTSQRLPRGRLDAKVADELVRAGFLTSSIQGTGASEGLFARPEDRTTFMSLETVARAASGSVGAVGGQGAVHAAGGSGNRARGEADLGDLSLAIPGNGAFIKLVSSALDQLTAILSRCAYREAPEALLREKWDGGVVRDAQEEARRSRGEFSGILPGRTRKWKTFHGLNFDWLLAEAVGSGLVEVFQTRTVGRGVRLL